MIDKGTLCQLKHLINRTAVPVDPSHNMKAAEDFLTVVMHAHIIAACDVILQQRQPESVFEIAETMLESFNTLSVGESNAVCDSDGVLLYACDLLTLGLLWMGFHDAIREGDGDRVMSYWKFFLPLFKVMNRRNYSIEAVNMQLQRKYHLSERQAAQLVWTRFVNTRGRQGCNIPCDLHIEHLNRRLKTSIRHLSSNVQATSVVRAAKSIGVVHRICSIFENETRPNTGSDKHSDPGFGKDYDQILSALKEAKVFSSFLGRSHSCFPMKKAILESFNKEKYLDWVKARIDLT